MLYFSYLSGAIQTSLFIEFSNNYIQLKSNLCTQIFSVKDRICLKNCVKFISNFYQCGLICGFI